MGHAMKHRKLGPQTNKRTEPKKANTNSTNIHLNILNYLTILQSIGYELLITPCKNHCSHYYFSHFRIQNPFSAYAIHAREVTSSSLLQNTSRSYSLFRS